MVVFPKKWNAVVPASLVSIIIATAVSIIFKLPTETVGAIPKTLLLDERFSFAGFDISSVKGLISPAISIAALGMVESLLCGASAGRMTGVKLDNDRELIAQGIGNIISPLMGGIPATAAIARTSVAIKSGARTRLTAVIHSVILLVSMLLLGPVMSKIPLAALAGVLLVTAWRMNEWHTIKYMFSHKFKGAILKFLVTMIATIIFDLTVAILIGVAVSLVLLVAKLSKLSVHIDENDNDTSVSLSGAALFANTAQISAIYDGISGEKEVEFIMTGVSYMDISAAQELLELVKRLKDDGVKFRFTGVGESVEIMMKRSGISDIIA